MIVPLAIRRLDHAPSQPGHATTPRKHFSGEPAGRCGRRPGRAGSRDARRRYAGVGRQPLHLAGGGDQPARQEPSLIAITRNPNCISTMVCSTSRLERPRSDQVDTQHDHVEAELARRGQRPVRCVVRLDGTRDEAAALPWLVSVPAASASPKRSPCSAAPATPGLSLDHSWLPGAVSPAGAPYSTCTTPENEFSAHAPTARSARPSALKSPS